MAGPRSRYQFTQKLIPDSRSAWKLVYIAFVSYEFIKNNSYLFPAIIRLSKADVIGE